MALVCFLSACSNDLKTKTGVSVSGTGVSVSEAEAETESGRCQIKISTDYNCDIMIPDPEECIGKSHQILLYHGNSKSNKDNEKKNKYNEKGYGPSVDLSFLGIKEPVHIVNYAIGKMGSTPVQDIGIIYEDTKGKQPEEEKIVSGNCLVLTLIRQTSGNGYTYDYTESDRAYLAVLDYVNGKHYVVRTGLYPSTMDQLNLCDFTGDGEDEMILSGIANKWMEWQMFKLDGDKLQEIRSDYYEENEDTSVNMIANAFRTKIISPDKIKIIGKGFKFEKEISAKKAMDQRGLEDYDISIEGEAGEIWGYDYFDNVDSEKGICIKLDVSLYGETTLAKIKVFLKYNEKEKKMEIYNVKVKSVKE